MSGRKRLRAVRLIAKEDAIDGVPCSGRRLCFPNFHHRPDFSAAAHRTAFYLNRELGWNIFNSFAGQLNAIEEKYQISRSGHDATYERKGAPPGLSAKDRFLIFIHSVGKIYQPLVIFF
jgi:hypothetical protein